MSDTSLPDEVLSFALLGGQSLSEAVDGPADAIPLGTAESLFRASWMLRREGAKASGAHWLVEKADSVLGFLDDAPGPYLLYVFTGSRRAFLFDPSKRRVHLVHGGPDD